MTAQWIWLAQALSELLVGFGSAIGGIGLFIACRSLERYVDRSLPHDWEPGS